METRPAAAAVRAKLGAEALEERKKVVGRLQVDIAKEDGTAPAEFVKDGLPAELILDEEGHRDLGVRVGRQQQRERADRGVLLGLGCLEDAEAGNGGHGYADHRERV